MVKCTTCGSELRKGTGTMYVFKTGDINYFCSLRCYKNKIVLKRKMNPKEYRRVKK
jgi:ribosomal protein L24E